MSELEGVASYVFRWTAHATACRKCQDLSSREWRGQDLFQPELIDPVHGAVWDLDADHSLAHGRLRYNCRCQLTVYVELDWSEWEELNHFRETIRSWR